MSDRAALAVAVATRGRPVRLRWLLNALSEQDCEPDRFEVVVAHDPACATTVQVLGEHPLRRNGRLRPVPFPPGNRLAAAGRNAAWQATQAPLILFTDDDCRPPPEWISCALAASRDRDGAVLQGRTLPDPDETSTLIGATWTRTVVTDPPTPWAESCNIAYPRALLERLGGFQPEMRMGEDTDLWLRAKASGALLVGVPEMLTYHAVHEQRLLGAIRSTWRWRDVAWLAKRQPSARRDMWGGIWWKPEHAALCLALAGAGGVRSHRTAAVLAIPWLGLSMRHRGSDLRGILRSLSELPGRALIDAAEIVTMASGSIRFGTILL